MKTSKAQEQQCQNLVATAQVTVLQRHFIAPVYSLVCICLLCSGGGGGGDGCGGVRRQSQRHTTVPWHTFLPAWFPSVVPWFPGAVLSRFWFCCFLICGSLFFCFLWFCGYLVPWFASVRFVLLFSFLWFCDFVVLFSPGFVSTLIFDLWFFVLFGSDFVVQWFFVLLGGWFCWYPVVYGSILWF